MKSKYMQRFLYPFLLILLVSKGCEQFTDDPNTSIEFQPLQKQREYVREGLKPIGRALLGLANDPEFRQILYHEIEKKFDGEYNVLIQDLLKVRTASGKTVQEKMEEKVGAGIIQNALAKFRGIEGRNYFPQIFIPFYENLHNRSSLRSEKFALFEDVVAVFYDGNETLDVVNGFTLNEDGEFVESLAEIDESFAMENEVWVVSLNESGSPVTQLYGDYIDADPGSFPGGATPRLNGTPGSAIINLMKCKCHKESWLAGASEVHILTIFTANSTSAYTSVETYQNGYYEGGRIHKFTRSSVRDKAEKTVDFSLNGYWESRPSATFSHNVIFEYDVWPTGKRTAEWDFNGQFLNLEYRSADKAYEISSISKDDFNNYSVVTNCIEWKGR